MRLPSPLETLRAFPQALGLLVSSPRLLVTALAPISLGVVTTVASFVLLLFLREEVAILLTADPTSWLSTLVSWAVIPLFLVVGALLGLLTVIVAGEFFFEKMVRAIFAHYEVPLAGRSPTILHELREGAVKGMIFSLLAVFTLALSFIPGVNLIVFAISAWVIGYGLLEFPLSAHGIIGAPQRRIATRSPFSTILLGLPQLLLSSIPLIGLLYLPFGVTAATIVVVTSHKPLDS